VTAITRLASTAYTAGYVVGFVVGLLVFAAIGMLITAGIIKLIKGPKIRFRQAVLHPAALIVGAVLVLFQLAGRLLLTAAGS
jgi:hypothetical protein